MRNADGIPNLVGAIYDAALDASRWPSVLEQFAHVFGSTSAHLSEDNVTSTGGKLMSYGFDPVFAGLYAQYYASRNILWKNILQRSLDGVLTDRIIMPRDELVRSEFYHDYLQPQGGEEVLCFIGAPHQDVCMNLVLMREHRSGVWGTKEMKALAAVTPHFSRSLEINRQIGDLRIVSELADEALYHINCGVIFVDAHASVLFANRVAERLFENRGLRLGQNRLLAPLASETKALHRLIAGTALSGIGDSLVISRPSGAPLLVSATLMKARSAPASGVILFVRAIDACTTPNLSSFVRHFRLTRAEASFAAELIKADGVSGAAERLGISRATARTHLIHIFQKTGTGRQAELVRLMLTWAEPAARRTGHA